MLQRNTTHAAPEATVIPAKTQIVPVGRPSRADGPAWATVSAASVGWLAALCVALAAVDVFAQGHVSLVSVVPAQKRMVRSTIELVGSVRPYTRSLIASEVAGLVEALPVEEGDRLKEGDAICRLRRRTRELALEEAKARLRQLDEQWAELKAGTRKEEITRAKAEMEEARAIKEKWEKELERLTGLRDQGSAGLKEYNHAVADAAAARERLAQAAAKHNLAVAGPRKEEVTRAEFAVEAQRVAVARLEYDLKQCEIRAPFAGYVTQKHTELGQWIAGGGNVVELIDLDRVLVRVDVPESAIAGAREAKERGEPVAVVVEALGKTFRGTIKHIIPQADEKARTFPVEVELDNRQHDLGSGMFTRVRMPAGPAVESVIVPRDAILQRGGGHYLVIVGPAPPPAEGQFAMPVPVQLGADVGTWVAIHSSSVGPGVPVAVKGHDRIYGPGPTIPRPASVPAPEAARRPSSQPAGAPASGQEARTASLTD